jgi:hypothetical protein
VNGWGGLGLGAQDEGVDEEPDDVLQFGSATAGDSGAYGNVPLVGVAGQQHLHGGGQRHERGGTVFMTERRQLSE